MKRSIHHSNEKVFQRLCFFVFRKWLIHHSMWRLHISHWTTDKKRSAYTFFFTLFKKSGLCEYANWKRPHLRQHFLKHATICPTWVHEKMQVHRVKVWAQSCALKLMFMVVGGWFGYLKMCWSPVILTQQPFEFSQNGEKTSTTGNTLLIKDVKGE